MKKIVAGSTAVLLMLTASGALIGCKSTPDESTSSSDSSLESTSGVDSAGADADFDIDGEERETDSSGEGDDAEAPDGDAAAEGSGETAREGAQSWITSDGTASSNREDEKKEGGFGNSYGLASGEGVNGDGVAVMKGGEAGEVDTSASGSAPNDEENFPSTMERLKNADKGSASSDGIKADGDGTDASAAGTETASAESGGSRQSAVAPNANDSSTAGLGDRSKHASGSSSGTGSGAGTGTGGKAAGGSASGSGADGTSGGSAKNGNAKNNGSGISGTSSIDGSRNANPTAAKPQAESRTGNKNDKSSGANGPGTGSAAQNGTNKNGTGSGSGSGAQNGNKNGTGAGTGSGTGKNGTGTASANSGTNKNASGAGNTTAQNGTNKNASGNGGNGTSTNASGTNANGNGNGRNAGSGTNATAGASGNGAGNASGKDASAAASASKGTNTGKEIAKADGTSGGTAISTNGSGSGGKAANDSASGVAQSGTNGNANGGKAGNGAGGTAAKDRQGMTGDGTTDYVEKFSKWFHPALADVQRCGYFYTTPEICQFDMIQGDFRKVSGYKKAAYGFVFGYSQPDPRGYLSDYIRFEINVDGEYALYTWDGQNYVDLVEPNDRGTAYFYEHPAIYKGYNTLNQIKIEDTGSSYNVYVNGTLIQGNIPYLTGRATRGVMAFFSVAKEHQEDLPRTPVNVGMRITDVKRH